jgi:uncharacterized membrane protein
MQNPSAFGDASVKSSTGLDANIAALLSYFPLGIVGGLIFFFMEKSSRFVKFHAMQSILFNGLVIVVTIGVFILFGILGALSVAMGGGFIVTILWGLMSLVCVVFYLAVFVGAVLLLIKAFQGQTFKLPVLGNMAEKFASK